MTERNEHVEALLLLRRFVIGKYREQESGHLATCDELTVAELDAYNSTYGCDTGCDYVRFEAELTCPHGERAEFEWGDFDDMASIIGELEALDRRA